MRNFKNNKKFIISIINTILIAVVLTSCNFDGETSSLDIVEEENNEIVEENISENIPNAIYFKNQLIL
ncbi:MAG: hypothetical protein ACOWWH_14055 [Eubacteriaceae bacterium]